MSHSQILFLRYFSTKYDFIPWIEENYSLDWSSKKFQE